MHTNFQDPGLQKTEPREAKTSRLEPLSRNKLIVEYSQLGGNNDLDFVC